MARVEDFSKISKDRARLHDTVAATYATFMNGPEPILQIDTYGKDDRKFVGAISQSIQVDREAAMKLRDIIDKSFSL